MKNPVTDSHKYIQLILSKVQKQFNGAKTALSTNSCQDNWISQAKMNLNLNLTTHTKINLKCIMNLNVKYKTLKKEGENLQDIRLGTKYTKYQLELKFLAKADK